MSPKHKRIRDNLRTHALLLNQDDLYPLTVCCDCDDAADIIEWASDLCDAIDRAVELIDDTNPILRDIRTKRERLR